MTKLERRERALRKQKTQLQKQKVPIPQVTNRKGKGRPKVDPHLGFAESEALPYTSPELHHHISPSRNFHIDLPTWLAAHAGDRAIEVCTVLVLASLTMLTCLPTSPFYPISKSTSLAVCCILIGQEMVTSSHQRSVLDSSSSTTVCIVTKCFASTTPPTTFVAAKTP
jgi:hypothetical protein